MPKQKRKITTCITIFISQRKSIYPNVISVMEWYLGMITHVINSELGTKHVWTKY